MKRELSNEDFLKQSSGKETCILTGKVEGHLKGTDKEKIIKVS